jgi:nickel-dependent lactate racemase
MTQEAIDLARNAERICIVPGSSRKKSIVLDAIKSLIASFVNAEISLRKVTILGTPQSDPIEVPSEVTVIQHSPTESETTAINGYSGDFRPTISRVAAESKMVIAIGELRLNHFTGYAGLCDLIFPSLASAVSAREELIRNKPMEPHDLQKERLAMASSLRNIYALGFVLKYDMSIADIFLGSFNDTVNRLIGVVDRVSTIEARKTADIVVMSAGGAPLDESLLRAVETFPAGLSVLKRNGALIVAAECAHGHGGTDFYSWSNEHKEARHLESRLRRRFNYYGWKAAYLLRALANHRIYLVSTIPDHYVERAFGLRAAKTMNVALESAQRALGADSSVTAIPDASQTIPRIPLGTTATA